MTQAEAYDTTLPLSALFRDPDVRAAFYRAEREDGAAFAVTTREPELVGGAAAELVPA